MSKNLTRRKWLQISIGACSFGLAGCSSDTDNQENEVNEPGSNNDDDFQEWVNEDELEDGYTVVYISSDWEITDKEDADSWNPETVKRFRRGFCKRYFVFENLPESHEVFYQGQCENGVKATVEDEDGKVIAQISLPEKSVDR
jgi:hypothetical protein